MAQTDTNTDSEYGVHAYCNDCQWAATPRSHPTKDVSRAAVRHTQSENGHCASVGRSQEIVAEAKKRVDTNQS